MARADARTALITGGAGFVGGWLARALDARGVSVVIGTLDPSVRPLAGEAVHLDVRSAPSVAAAVSRHRPDWIFHLAGIAYPPAADEDPGMTYDVNVGGAVRLLDAVVRERAAGAYDPAVVIVGSSTQYGAHPPEAMPLRETASQRPVNVYGASKGAQEIAALQCHRAEGIRVMCTRSFNHSGRGQERSYLMPALVARALEARRSGGEALRIGNDAVRDFLHVEDVATAYISIAERGRPGEVYNVCSGEPVTVRQLAADTLLRVGVTAEIAIDSALVRPTDIPVLVGSFAKLHADTGWAPTRSVGDILEELIHAQAD